MAIYTHEGIEQPYDGLDRQEPALAKAGWTRTHDDAGNPVGDAGEQASGGPADEHVVASDDVAVEPVPEPPLGAPEPAPEADPELSSETPAGARSRTTRKD